MGGSSNKDKGFWTNRARYYESFNIPSEKRKSDVDWVEIEAKSEEFTKKRVKTPESTPYSDFLARADENIGKISTIVDDIEHPNSDFRKKLLKQYGLDKPADLDSVPNPNKAFRCKKGRTDLHEESAKVAESLPEKGRVEDNEGEDDMWKHWDEDIAV